MLEGKELEGKIGDSGSYSVDLDDKLMLELSVRIDLFAEIKKIAGKTENKVIKGAIDFIGKLVGRD